jgi:hypothetical protein
VFVDDAPVKDAKREVGGGYDGCGCGKVQRTRFDPWLKGNRDSDDDREKGEVLEKREGQVWLLSGRLAREGDRFDIEKEGIREQQAKAGGKEQETGSGGPGEQFRRGEWTE